jgi:hypothetical protein
MLMVAMWGAFIAKVVKKQSGRTAESDDKPHPDTGQAEITT